MQAFKIEEIEAAYRDALIQIWKALHHTSPPRQMSAPMMRRILAFDVQAQEHGGLSGRFLSKLEKQAEGARSQLHRKMGDGTRFMREWNGRTHVVDLIDGRYHWNGQPYRSLSVIAREITGAHWSGPRFFGVSGRT